MKEKVVNVITTNPRNWKQELGFSLIIDFIMCFFMSLYNTLLSVYVYSDGSTESVAWEVNVISFFGELMISLIVVIIVSFFVTKFTAWLSLKAHKHDPKNNNIFLSKKKTITFTLLMVLFTVIIMCTLMSLFATAFYRIPLLGASYKDFGKLFLETWWHNAVFAFPLQFLVAQPISRYVLYRYQNRKQKEVKETENK